MSTERNGIIGIYLSIYLSISTTTTYPIPLPISSRILSLEGPYTYLFLNLID